MANSRASIIKEHQDFLESYGADSTAEERTKWHLAPVRYVKKHLAEEREKFLKRLVTDPANVTVLEEEIEFHKATIKALEEEVARRKQAFAIKMGWHLT